MWAWTSSSLAPERRRDAVDEVGERAWTVADRLHARRRVRRHRRRGPDRRGAAAGRRPARAPADRADVGRRVLPDHRRGRPRARAAVLVALVADGPTGALIVLGGDRDRPAGRGQRPVPGRRRPAAEAAPDRRARVGRRWAGRWPGIAGAFLAVPGRDRVRRGRGYAREQRDRREAEVPVRQGVLVGNGRN